MSASSGIVAVDRRGCISFTTEAAEAMLRLADGIGVWRGRLSSRGRAAGLEEAIRATLSDPLAQTGRPPRTVLLPRRDALPLLAIVTPLATEATGALGALVLLHDPQATLRPATALLRHAFGLTAAEAAVAQGVVAGATLREIAEDRQVSLNTVRTLLSRVLDKTGARRQADLVRLLMPLAMAEAVQAGFEAGYSLGVGGRTMASLPLRPVDLLRADLALVGRQEAQVTHYEFAPGRVILPHSHADAHEIVYVLSGSQRGEWGAGETRLTGPGELLHYGPTLLHGGSNPGTVATRLLVTRIVRRGAARHPSA